MKSTKKFLTTVFIFIILTVLLSACDPTKTCKWVGCDSYAALGSDYCSDHKTYGEAAEQVAEDAKNAVDGAKDFVNGLFG